MEFHCYEYSSGSASDAISAMVGTFGRAGVVAFLLFLLVVRYDRSSMLAIFTVGPSTAL